MKKKNIGKLFCIGAALLLVTLSIAPLASSLGTTINTYVGTSDPEVREFGAVLTKKQMCDQFFTQHQSDLAVIEAYLAGIDLDNPPDEYPGYIADLLVGLSEDLEVLLDQTFYLVRHDGADHLNLVKKVPSPPFYGYNRKLMTVEPIDVEGEDYIGHCWAFDNDVTEMIRYILDNYGVPAVLVYITALLVGIAPPIGVLFGIYVFNHKDEIIDAIPIVNQGSGVRFFIYDSVDHIPFFYNIVELDAQPGTDWVLPYPWVIIWDF